MLDPNEGAPSENVISPTAARLKTLCLDTASTPSAQGNFLFPHAMPIHAAPGVTFCSYLLTSIHHNRQAEGLPEPFKLSMISDS